MLVYNVAVLIQANAMYHFICIVYQTHTVYRGAEDCFTKIFSPGRPSRVVGFLFFSFFNFILSHISRRKLVG